MVDQLVDTQASARKYVIKKSMNKIIEADFFPRQSEGQFPSPGSIARFAIKQAPRILIVDDNRDFIHSIKLALERTGRYFVCAEDDATKAHQSARNFRPDLILLDIVMPEIDGGEIAAQIQADPELRRTPIIFLTALVTKAEAKAGLRIQGHPFLAKPVTIPELIDAIEENLPEACRVLSRT
jgi:two-component system, OmpR family, response regulator